MKTIDDQLREIVDLLDIFWAQLKKDQSIISASFTLCFAVEVVILLVLIAHLGFGWWK